MSMRSIFLFTAFAAATLAGCMDKSLPPQSRETDDLRDVFAYAIADGDEAKVRQMLEGEPLLLNEPIPNLNNCTPLHCAARAGEAGIVRYLLEQGADPYLMDDEGQLPQDVAVSSGVGQEVVDLLRVR